MLNDEKLSYLKYIDPLYINFNKQIHHFEIVLQYSDIKSRGILINELKLLVTKNNKVYEQLFISSKKYSMNTYILIYIFTFLIAIPRGNVFFTKLSIIKNNLSNRLKPILVDPCFPS